MILKLLFIATVGIFAILVILTVGKKLLKTNQDSWPARIGWQSVGSLDAIPEDPSKPIYSTFKSEALVQVYKSGSVYYVMGLAPNGHLFEVTMECRVALGHMVDNLMRDYDA